MRFEELKGFPFADHRASNVRSPPLADIAATDPKKPFSYTRPICFILPDDAAPATARSPRPSAEYRWTNRKAHAFLDALAQQGKVAAAARAVGMTRQSAYKLKDRVPVVA